MKKLFYVVVLLLGVTVYAQNSVTELESSLIFEQETIDYGVIEQNSDGIRIFKVTNTGDKPLVITKVKATCGCTVPNKPNDPIFPGKSADISVSYDTKKLGKFAKTITVYSNDVNPIKHIKIKGEVVKS